MYLLKGSSGAGKTTLLSMLGLLDTPSDGEIYYDDLLVSKLNEEQKQKSVEIDLVMFTRSIIFLVHLQSKTILNSHIWTLLCPISMKKLRRFWDALI